MAYSPDLEIPVVLMRGGTSKGVFVRAQDLPPAGPARDGFVLALMGTPNPMQIDGLGGTHSSTSKLMAISPSTRPGRDVDYLFAQVGTSTAIVDYAGNCGNLTAAVGAYAVNEKLVPAVEPVTTVRLFNENTALAIDARVPVANGRAATTGDTVLAGVPRPGAGIRTDYLDPAGAVTGKLLPTGKVREMLIPDLGGPVEVSIVDASAPVVFARAEDFGITARTLPGDINADPGLLSRLESVRGSAAALLGFCPDEASAGALSPVLPRIVLVHAPMDHRTADGTLIPAAAHELLIRATSLQRAHHACPQTSLLCTAAAARLPGTIPHETARDRTRSGMTSLRIAHPKGVVEVTVIPGAGQDDDGAPRLESVGVTLTARRLLAGTAYVPTQ